MSDPLSIAAGVVGILTAAAQISSVLIKFARSAKGALHQAQVIITEIHDTSGVLSHLQAFLLGKEFADTSRTSMLKIDHVVDVISGCVLTFSELEKLLDELKTNDMNILDRMKWARKEAAIASLIQRLQNHKASLSLILNILNGFVFVFDILRIFYSPTNNDKRESIIEAKNSVNQLCTLVENHYQEMSFRLKHLERLESKTSDDLAINEDDARSIVTVAAESSNAMKSITRAAGVKTFGFTKDLENSWVYQRNSAFSKSNFSISTSSMLASRWSCLAALSMADVSIISVMNLSITQSEVFNAQRSTQTWSNEYLDPGRPSKIKTVDGRLLAARRPRGPIFGVSLEELMKRDDSAIPLVVYKCIRAVELYGLKTEGIYGRCNSMKSTTKLQLILQHGKSAFVSFDILQTVNSSQTLKWILVIPSIF